MRLLLVAICLMGGVSSAWASDPIYSWVGGSSDATETGGTAAGTFSAHTTVAGTIYAMTVAGNSNDLSTGGVTITLASALQEGDVIKVTGFQDKNASDKATALYMSFDQDATNKGNISDTENWVNLNTTEGCATGSRPDLKTYKVTAALAGSNKITLIRTNGKTGTNLFISKLQIVRPVVNADIDFSNAITDGAVAGTVNSMTIGSGEIARNGDTGWLSVYDATSTVTIPEAQRAGSKDVVNVKFKTAWGNKSAMGFGFNLKDASGDALAAFQYARWDSKSTNSNTLNIDMSGLVGGHNGNKPLTGRYTLFDVTVDYAARTITSVVYCNDTNGKGATKTETFVASLTNTNPIATFNIFGYGVGDNTDRASIFDDLKITTLEGDYSVVTYDYTVNWVCGSSVIKSAIRQGEKNAAISLLATDKTPFTENTIKYFYVNDDASGKTVADDGSTVVTVNVRQAEDWNYTVNAVDEGDNILGVITSGTVVEGEDIYYYYPTFFLNGTDLLRADINDKTYGKGATPVADDAVYNVVYKDVSISNVVFYQECENIEGLTAVTAGNVPVRCSNGKGAMASATTKIATLSPGKYKISGFAWGNSGTVFALTANEDSVATFTTASSTVNVSTSDEFTLTATTDIKLGAQGNGGSSPKVIDFIYIQKTGEAATVGANGYATFASPYALDLTDANRPEGLKAYKATLDGTALSFTALNQKVPAGTGLLLVGETKGGSYNIPVVVSGDAVADNALTGVTDATDKQSNAEGDYIFVMKKATQASDALTFLPLTTASVVTIPAGKAYVTVPASAFTTPSRSLSISFDDETTGISRIENGELKIENSVYDLQGRRVTKPMKGLYIKNGKKIIVK